MRFPIRHHTLEVVVGDLTTQPVDAIVNAANSALAGGGGVDGAIHARGGPSIMADTDARYPDGCPTGSAVISTGGSLLARYVIHAVGPVYRGGGRGEAELLASAYRRSIELASEHRCRSIAFPAISTGVYSYPFPAAAEVAIPAVIDALQSIEQPFVVKFVFLSAAPAEIYREVIERFVE